MDQGLLVPDELVVDLVVDRVSQDDCTKGYVCLLYTSKELFNLRFQNATNQLDNTSRIKEVRKNIARIQTVITEKSQNA